VVAAGGDFFAGGFDLDAVELGAVVGDGIVAVVVAVGAGDVEAFVGGAVEERDFGEVAAALGGDVTWGLEGKG